MSRTKGRAASGFKPKLHGRSENLSLEKLCIKSGKSRHESHRGSRKSLHTKIWSQKFGHGSRKFGHRLSRLMSRLLRPNVGMSRLSPATARLMSRLSRLKLSARLCILGVNPDTVRSSKCGSQRALACISHYYYI